MKQGYKASNRTDTEVIQVEGQPKPEVNLRKEVFSSPIPERKENTKSCHAKITIDIRMTNGMRIQQRNLTYQNLRTLIEIGSKKMTIN